MSLYLVLFLALAPIAWAGSDNDAKHAGLLKGSWSVVVDDASSPFSAAETTFQADGTFVSYAVFRTPSGPLRIDAEGKWEVKDGFLIEEITKSSHPQIPPIGFTSKDKIVSLDASTYVVLTEKGTKQKNVRKEQAAKP